MAISNHRITAFDGERVSFSGAIMRRGGKQKVMTLHAVNFLCRFFLHVLPKGFVRIRRYGLLSTRGFLRRCCLARTLLRRTGTANRCCFRDFKIALPQLPSPQRCSSSATEKPALRITQGGYRS